MATLARELAERDLRVALIVWPMERPDGLNPNLDFVERPHHVGVGARFGKLREAARIWRACADADASIYLYRGGGPLLWVVSAFCRLRRRKLVFSAASDLDFDFDRPDRTGSQLALYRRALPHVDLIVAQREEQRELARAAGFAPVVMIRSSSLPAEPTQQEGEAFLWISRLVDYKRPLSYLRLAESVPEARFWAVWSVTDETRPGLTEEVDSALERISNLEVLGQLPHEELLSLIDRAVAVVSTSAAEGMPNVFLEAWAREVPVLSLDYDPDGRIQSLGLGIVAGNSEERFSEAARELWERPELRSQMGMKAREYVLGEHSPGVVADRWAMVLKSLIAGDHAPGEEVPA
jgi:glycosyltransferase involved in cell wall biosynthesis